MVIDFNYLHAVYGLDITGVIHVGAHYGEEIDAYKSVGISKIVCFEPVKDNYNVLRERHPDVNVYKCALGNTTGFVDMFLSSNAKESSSILEPVEHLLDYPDITFLERETVPIVTLDDMIMHDPETIDNCNYLSIDVQGYEWEVLDGARDALKDIDYVYLEVNRGETYAGNKILDDIDAILYGHGFRRVETQWMGRTWGDAFYMKAKD